MPKRRFAKQPLPESSGRDYNRFKLGGLGLKRLARLIVGLFKAGFFFTLFAFALNNQHEVVVHFFFGHQWSTSLVVLVLLTLCVGVVLGVLAMVPRWWRSRRTLRQASTEPAAGAAPSSSAGRLTTKDLPASPHTVVPPPDSIYGL